MNRNESSLLSQHDCTTWKLSLSRLSARAMNMHLLTQSGFGVYCECTYRWDKTAMASIWIRDTWCDSWALDSSSRNHLWWLPYHTILTTRSFCRYYSSPEWYTTFTPYIVEALSLLVYPLGYRVYLRFVWRTIQTSPWRSDLFEYSDLHLTEVSWALKWHRSAKRIEETLQ